MFGPTRYQWDSGYYQGAIERSVQTKLASNKSVEQVGARVAGGVLAGSVFSNIRTVIQFARRAQLGEMIDFDREVHHSRLNYELVVSRINSRVLIRSHTFMLK